MCPTACAPGIDVGQATGTGNGTSGGASTGSASTTSTGTTTGAVAAGDAGLEVAPNPLDFGTIATGLSVTKTVTLTNLGDATIEGITELVSGPQATWFEISGAPSSLAVGASTNVSMSFSPPAAASAASATVTFSASGIEPTTLALTGNAVVPALTFSTVIVDFGFVPLLSTVVECTTATNVGGIDVTISGVMDFAAAGNAFALATTDDATPPNPISFPITIPPTGSAKICFALTPPITQDYFGQVTLVTDDPSAVDPIIQLAGWGGGPQITCTPPSLTFDVSGSGSGMLPVTCNNTGTAIPGINLVFGALTTSPSYFSAEFESDPGAGLAPGQSATIAVGFSTFVFQDAGAIGTLSIPSNGGQGNPVVIQLSSSGN